MFRLAVLFFLLTAATEARAQYPDDHVRQQPDSAARKLIGTWEGTLSSPHGTAEGFTVAISHERDAWTVTMTSPPGQPSAGTISDVKVTATGLSWTQTVMQMPCKGSASLIGETLKGETDCGHVSLGFVLKRK
jgi:hypothetical protein